MKPFACVSAVRLLAALLLLVLSSACNSGESAPAGSTTPAPGATTLAGVDANNNGIRDDVETYIDSTTVDANTKAALRQYAKVAQSSILDANDPGKSITHVTERFRALECLMARQPANFHPIFVELRARILDSKERSAEYLKADSHAAAVDIPLIPAHQWVNQCAP